MNDQAGNPFETAPLRLSRRALLTALTAVGATSLLKEEASATPQNTRPPGPPIDSGLPRRMHTAVVLENQLVLVSGGVDAGTLADCQLFNPNTGHWHDASPMHTPRAQHAAVLLEDGRVLVLGGFYQGALADAEIYTPHKNLWTPAPPMAIPRYDHTAVLLGDGSVLIYGGVYQGVLDSPEIYSLSRHDDD